MKFYGDLMIRHTDDGGDIVFQGGQPEMDGGLWTAAYISLFTERGWWGDPSIGSALHELEDRALTNQTRLDAIAEAKRALTWLVDQGIAQSVEIDAEIASARVLIIQATITQPNDPTPTEFRYRITWASTKEAV